MKQLSLVKAALFTGSLLLGAVSAQAACNGCVGTGPVDLDLDDIRSYSAVVKYRVWFYNSNGQYTSQVQFLTLTGSTMAYCQQQLASVTNSPGVTVVQYCQAD
ncbi:hypothetical protein [Marinicella meishanensis]|uniref:hypothetical protein n=1 Tax=Marinicella meishanensis TaxID=2873263 RepID=UPI001CC16989|nr:hypothetical protein [Marinicella sp. NBU2979]